MNLFGPTLHLQDADNQLLRHRALDGHGRVVAELLGARRFLAACRAGPARLSRHVPHETREMPTHIAHAKAAALNELDALDSALEALYRQRPALHELAQRPGYALRPVGGGKVQAARLLPAALRLHPAAHRQLLGEGARPRGPAGARAQGPREARELRTDASSASSPCGVVARGRRRRGDEHVLEGDTGPVAVHLVACAEYRLLRDVLVRADD